MGTKRSFIVGFEKKAAKGFINWLKNPAAAERRLKKTNKYHLSRLALGVGIPLAGTAYLAHKTLARPTTQSEPLKLQTPPNYY